jgi:phosphopantetheinyl transferase
LRDYFRERLNLPFEVYFTDSLCLESLLSENEKEILANFNSQTRKQNWLLGRQAIKQVIKNISNDFDNSSLSFDTAQIKFPCNWLSLSHSADLAIAIALPQTIKLKGLGLDLQLNKFPKAGSEKFFVKPSEKEILNNLPEKDPAKNRCLFWTIKEACYKANPENQNTFLSEYEITNFDLGLAKKGIYQFKFASLALPNGFLSVAICP